MKKKFTKSQTEPGSDSKNPIQFSTAAFRKENKKRILHDAFYPRWELELLSSFAFVFILWILPYWIADTNNLLSTKYEVDIDATWIDIVSKLIFLGFVFSFILRIIWLRLVWK